ncbi:type II toxin-antitoxin system VapC family toxin [Mesorhizobium salmacidum]|uniref:PIN domain-containing protein n=1 Tax=Mesorhizobium salmacidum TaxID=3015171 RepID=A0ABU8KTV9_9HYPH
MIVAFDASTLIYLFDDKAAAPSDQSSGKVVDRCRDRIEHLIETLANARAKIIIPTPALAEVLVRAQEGAPERLRILKSSKYFKIVPFDERAAVEFAAIQTVRQATGTRSTTSPRAKAKFDDQIVAIAVVEGATELYSDDSDISKLAGSRMKVLGMTDLPLPPEDAQTDIFSLLPPGSQDVLEPE